MNLATKLEAYESSLLFPGKPVKTEDGKFCLRSKKVYAIGKGEEAKDALSLQRQVTELQKTLAQAMEHLEELTVEAEQ